MGYTPLEKDIRYRELPDLRDLKEKTERQDCQETREDQEHLALERKVRGFLHVQIFALMSFLNVIKASKIQSL